MGHADPPRSGDVNTPDRSTSSRRQSLAGRLAYAAWLNLQVWIPQLLPAHLRERLVTYWGRESRDGTTWMIALPAACYRCGSHHGLTTIRLERRVRGFDGPLGVLYTSGMAAAATLAIGMFFGWYGWYLATAFILFLGPALVWSRSWVDDVKLSISTCSEHAADLEFPDLVLYERDLYLFAPTRQLAEAARSELDAERRRDKLRLHEEAPQPAPTVRERDTRRPEGFVPPRREPASREPLPPIPLDDPQAGEPGH